MHIMPNQLTIIKIIPLIVDNFYVSMEKETSGRKGEKIGSGVQGDVYSNGDQVTKKYASTLGNEFLEYVDKPKEHIVQGEMEAWNAFYKRYDPSFATASIDRNGNLVMPKIPGIGANKYLQSGELGEHFKKDLSLFKQMVKQVMQDVTGKEMRDQKDNDVLVSILPSGNYRFLQVDFGEFGMYKLINEVERSRQVQESNNSPH
ncbi:hypothetical protein [Legionella resiliens]|uniref:Substrate of the Dot/Icm secretion system n=1 Tax=Legionella resiliens TaxID=2905958 RepID=A0ABS8X169_9GAMM|nr:MULTISPECIES: hypothetical protein [unclassified Legionella]MCE0721888.1 hypothetical protein [Legionella sp. 9fVS26]MCE3531042.1 hypothetical protein [Legionella sp. 8cVS16]